MIERKQDILTKKFLDSLIESNQLEQPENQELMIHVKPSPIVERDESFSNLANRIVDEVITSTSHTDLAKRVLKQAGINTQEGPAEPQVFNGHLRHVGKRARKVARIETNNLRIRKVKSQSRGLPPSLKRMGAPIETRNRPSLGMEDETEGSGRKTPTRRGKSKKTRRLFGR